MKTKYKYLKPAFSFLFIFFSLILSSCSHQQEALQDDSIAKGKQAIEKVLSIDDRVAQKEAYRKLTAEEKANIWTYKLSSTIDDLHLTGEKRDLIIEVMGKLSPTVFADTVATNDFLNYVKGDWYKKASNQFTPEQLGDIFANINPVSFKIE